MGQGVERVAGRGGGEGVEQALPQPGMGEAAEMAGDRAGIAEAFRQGGPGGMGEGNVEDGVEAVAAVSGAAGAGGAGGEVEGEGAPFRLGHRVEGMGGGEGAGAHGGRMA